MNSVKKNFSYNIIFQILTLIMPLITAPYIARVIGAEGQGIFSYTYSIAEYFVLFAMLGLVNYGNRTIAKSKEDSEKLSREFYSIYALQILSTSIVILIYIIYISFFGEEKYKIFSFMQLIYIASAFFNINWFFFGIEKFKLTVTRNIVIKVISVISIFLLVKQKEDLWKYILIMVVSSLISQVALWPFLKREISFIKPTWRDIKKHIKPNITLFIPVLAVSIYKIMDKIMLGNMATIENVGYYENAEKIINIPLSFMTALGTVMLPRISSLVEKGEKDTIKQYIDKSMEFVLFLSIPIFFGLMAIGEDFAILFFGKEFAYTGKIIKLLSVTIIFISWANVLRTQYLIPNEKDKQYIISVFLGAIINVILNSILIPRYNAVGAAIGTIFAELTVMLYQTFIVRSHLDIKRYSKFAMKFAVCGLIMYAIVRIFTIIINNEIILIVTQVVSGGISYFMINYKYLLRNIPNVPILKNIKFKYICKRMEKFEKQ